VASRQTCVGYVRDRCATLFAGFISEPGCSKLAENLLCGTGKGHFLEVCMSSLSVPYALGGTLTEQQRLIAQAGSVEPHARWLLDRIGILPGSSAVDFGCGLIGILNLLSERVGPAGVVVGIEREPRFAAMARTELSERGLQNTEVVVADALKTGLERSSYDFVHERLILINVPPASQEALLTEMMSVLKPGGTIALQEFDSTSCVCYPPHPSWDTLLGVWNDAFSRDWRE
jgi:SAM-dependent methyltransferase